jgi:hypothetical protein
MFLLFHDEVAAGGRRIEVAEELVGAGRQRTDIDDPLGSARDDLFSMQLRALELLRRRVGISDRQLDSRARGNFQLRRRELVILDCQDEV